MLYWSKMAHPTQLTPHDSSMIQHLIFSNRLSGIGRNPKSNYTFLSVRKKNLVRSSEQSWTLTPPREVVSDQIRAWILSISTNTRGVGNFLPPTTWFSVVIQGHDLAFVKNDPKISIFLRKVVCFRVSMGVPIPCKVYYATCITRLKKSSMSESHLRAFPRRR